MSGEFKPTEYMKRWLNSADENGRLPDKGPNGRRIDWRSLRRLEGYGYIRRRAYGTSLWYVLATAPQNPQKLGCVRLAH